MQKSERILIFELNWMGDILFSFPLIRAIRGAFPDIYIACAVVPRYIDLLINNPWINDVHALSDNNSVLSIGEKLAFVNMIRKEEYDTCFILKSSSTKTLMAVLAGIERRIGFKGKNAPLTDEVEAPEGSIHSVDKILALAGVLGIEKADSSYEYFLTEEDKERADALLHGIGGGVQRIVAINPGGNWDPKRWPSLYYVELSKQLLGSFDDVEIMITGAKKDIKMADEMVSMISDKRCYSMAGKTTINELAGLFKKCSLVISNDSGPLHLASATGATTIALFGPTTYKFTGPRGRGKNIIISKKVECELPCYKEKCDKEYLCMRSITVGEVFKQAEKVLAS